MNAQIIDGLKTAQEIREKLRDEITEIKKMGCRPKLIAVLVGDDPASKVYVSMKGKACMELGMDSETVIVDAEQSEDYLLNLVNELNQDKAVHGILVQLPLPRHIRTERIISAVLPEKDVDGFHPINRGRLVSGEECLVPCTPLGIQQMLIHNGFSPERKHVVIVGRSQIVGMPLANLLAQKKPGANATVSLCHSATPDLKHFTLQADILVAAIGSPKRITGDMIRQGAVVVDVGMNRVDDPSAKRGYRLVGDVDFESAAKVAGAITPVPGGVGPMTITMVIANTIKAAKMSLKN